MQEGSQISHWYTKEGEPKHFIIGANGKERDTTLRDARKLNLLPSVTEIIGILDKPGLNRWKENNVLYAALTTPRPEGISDDEFLKIVRQDAADEALQARDRGDEIHKCMESLFTSEQGSFADDIQHICYQAVVAIENYALKDIPDEKRDRAFRDNFIPEKTVAGEGYGGMIDLHNNTFVIDYKTKDITDKQWDDYQASKDPRMAYPEMCMQLSAYSTALGGGHRLVNIFIDRTLPGRVIIHEWNGSMYERFELLLRYWQLAKNYRPE